MVSHIELPYTIDALEPVISARTLEFHLGKHLQGYVDNLNKLIVGTKLKDRTLEIIIVISSEVENSKTVFNNAGQILNRNLYFTQFRPASVILSGAECGVEISIVSSCPAPTGHLEARIEKQWDTIDAFQSESESACATLFSAGWVWLQADAEGKLSIAQYPNADNPFSLSLNPLFIFDIWEHAYYLGYQNRSDVHQKELWGNWIFVDNRYSMS